VAERLTTSHQYLGLTAFEHTTLHFIGYTNKMEHALQQFGGKLPSLEVLKKHNEGRNVCPETAWIWGKDDEVRGFRWL
jgi:hypothetical protein